MAFLHDTTLVGATSEAPYNAGIPPLPDATLVGFTGEAPYNGHSPSALLDIGGLNKSAMAAGGAMGGAIAYGICKMKCPGASGGFMDNMPMGKAIIGAGNFLKGAASNIAGAGVQLATGEKSSLQNASLTGDDSTEKEEEEAADEADKINVPDIFKHYEATEYSICRLNCKFKAIAAAAASALGAGVAHKKFKDNGGLSGLMKSVEDPLDEATVGPWFGMMNAYDPRCFERLRAKPQLRKTARERSAISKYWNQDAAPASEQLVKHGRRLGCKFFSDNQTKPCIVFDVVEEEDPDEDAGLDRCLEGLPMAERLRFWESQLENARSRLTSACSSELNMTAE